MKQRVFIQMDNKDITIKEAFEKFITFKKMNNMSEETIGYYEGSLLRFSQFYDVNLPCSTINQDTVYDYIRFLQTRNIKAVTVNNYVRGLRVILYYFMELGYVRQFKIMLIKADKEIKETYTDNEIDILLRKPEINKCQFWEYRTWVMINYLLGTGNRLATMVNIKNEDVDYSAGVIALKRVKNRKQQFIPLSSALSKILKEYQLYRKGSPCDFLFCNSYGEQLAKRGVQSAIRRYNLKRGITKTSTHLFRHTFAKKWILNGGDIFRLQKILGHSCIDIVKEYVNMYGTDLQKQFDEFNPLDNITKDSEAKQKIKMSK